MLSRIVEFKDFSRLLGDFPVLFKADLIFKDFSRKPSKFKYFSSLCEPCNCWEKHPTVNSDFFARVLFSRKRFVKINTPEMAQSLCSESCPSGKF